MEATSDNTAALSPIVRGEDDTWKQFADASWSGCMRAGSGDASDHTSIKVMLFRPFVSAWA